MRILVVDDPLMMRTIIRQILEKEGHEVVAEANTGEEAVTLYQKYRPDLVTMDITMPDMNGVDATREIKKIDSNAKIIICSAMGQKIMVAESIKAGACNFIVKPFDDIKLLQVVSQTLQVS